MVIGQSEKIEMGNEHVWLAGKCLILLNIYFNKIKINIVNVIYLPLGDAIFSQYSYH